MCVPGSCTDLEHGNYFRKSGWPVSPGTYLHISSNGFLKSGFWESNTCPPHSSSWLRSDLLPIFPSFMLTDVESWPFLTQVLFNVCSYFVLLESTEPMIQGRKEEFFLRFVWQVLKTWNVCTECKHQDEVRAEDTNHLLAMEGNGEKYRLMLEVDSLDHFEIWPIYLMIYLVLMSFLFSPLLYVCTYFVSMFM